MLSTDIDRYVELHRAMGLKFRLQAGLLRHFAAFAEPRGDRWVRTETVLAWAAEAPSAAQRRNRLLVVRRRARRRLRQLRTRENSAETAQPTARRSVCTRADRTRHP